MADPRPSLPRRGPRSEQLWSRLRGADAGSANHREPAQGFCGVFFGEAIAGTKTMARAMEPLLQPRWSPHSSPLRPAFALLVMRLVGGPGVSGELLTITKPTGGTITSRGINCGTTGSDCSTTLPSGEPVELQTHADTGFMFTGYTGDCLSTGRTLMTSPRTCGGTFAPLPDVPAQVARLLTVTRPKGGTI